MNGSLKKFNTGKQLSDLQIELMITEIADILGKLRKIVYMILIRKRPSFC
jgi:hypothetical protein